MGSSPFFSALHFSASSSGETSRRRTKTKGPASFAVDAPGLLEEEKKFV